MEKILFLAHTEPDGTLCKAALESLGAAHNLRCQLDGSSLILGLIGAEVHTAANAIGGFGASRWLGVAGPEFAQSRYSTDIAATEALARTAGGTIIIAPGTSRWSRVLSGLTHRLGGQIDTHVTGVSFNAGTLQLNRWYYRQRMEASIQRTHRPWVILLDPGCQEAWRGEAGNIHMEMLSISLEAAQLRTQVTGVQAPPADEQTIRPDASLLFVAGAGWTKLQADGNNHTPEAEKIIVEFLQKTQASLGGSKSLVDLSGEGHAVLKFMTHLNQVGQTGATPRHPKGLSTCCHGEEPHAVGWRFINERRAVNLNPNCGWAQGKADVLYVADAFEVMRKVNALLS
jgi:electron transfer flavoprotein alpha subunit